jgi:hypothetical protein
MCALRAAPRARRKARSTTRAVFRLRAGSTPRDLSPLRPGRRIGDPASFVIYL